MTALTSPTATRTRSSLIGLTPPEGAVERAVAVPPDEGCLDLGHRHLPHARIGEDLGRV